MVRTDTGLHADQAGWHVGKPRFHLATRPFLPQHDGATLIETDDVERVLADIDTDHGDHTVEFSSHGVLLSLNASCQLIADSAGARPDHPITSLPPVIQGQGILLPLAPPLRLGYSAVP